MTKEDRELLLKDLCARLPYGVKIQVKEWTTVDTELKIGHIDRLKYDEIGIKPYLRPISSITEEERKEIETLIKENRPNPYGEINNKGLDNLLFSVSVTSSVLIDWLNSHRFDYRCLIEKGLALEAPNGMYNLNKK